MKTLLCLLLSLSLIGCASIKPIAESPETFALLILLTILQVADWCSTRTILAKGGRELNPIVAAGIKAVGMDAFLISKGLLVVALGCWIGTQTAWLLAALVVFYIGIVMHNWKSL
jgi:hypothetical protein